MLKAIDVAKDFEGPNGKLQILRGVNLEIKAGEIAFITGRSGAGKSTLLYLLGGLDRAARGVIEFEGQNIAKWKERALAEYRNQNIGFVFQFFHLLPELSVFENVLLPSRIKGKGKLARERSEVLIRRVGLWDRRDHLPSELSGGEQQRAAIARALVNRPKLVLCDEPTGNLDTETASSIHELIVELNGEGQTFCIVTHEESLVRRQDRIFRLNEGMIDRVTI